MRQKDELYMSHTRKNGTNALEPYTNKISWVLCKKSKKL